MKKLVALTAVGVGALAARRYLAMRDALAHVEPELRSPALPFVTVTYSDKTLPAIRRVYRIKSSPGPGVSVTTRQIGQPPVRVLITTPDGHQTARPAVLSLHGGGMIVGSPQLEQMTHGRIARDLGAVVVAPDYRLAPENPFPAALDDCMATLQWMREHAEELGIDADRIAAAGASAGGGLAAAVAQRSHDEGIPLRAQGLVYPMLDDRTVLRHDHEGRGQIVWIGVGDLDLYYPEDVTYAERLRASGVPCELLTVPRMYHAADGFAGKARMMDEFTQGLIDHLRANL